MTTTFRNALHAGARVDRYEIEAVIGYGGFGISYRAVDIESGERVALKEFLPSELATREADASVYPLSDSHRDNFDWGLERFLDEVHLLARFRHPNIVCVQRAFEGNGTAYMVMNYERGENLATCLKREGTLASGPLVAMLMPLLEGLELVHEAGFIHRDIKPSNIHLREDGGPVLLDFGSARQALKGKTRTLTALVSAGYAPLEQYFSRSDLQGPWTDIYALGATLYHCMSGDPPIDAVERSRGVLGSTRDILPSAAEVARNDYPPCLLAAVDHALRVEDRERPRSVDQWRTELTGEAPVPSPPVTRQVTPAGETKNVTGTRHEAGLPSRLRTRTAPVALVALPILALGSLGWWQKSDSNRAVGEAITSSASVITPDDSAERLSLLRTSLEDATSAAETASRRAEELEAELERLEAERNRETDVPTDGNPSIAAARRRVEQNETLVTELRATLERMNAERDAAQRRIGELEARLRLLLAVQQTGNEEAPSARAKTDALLAAAAEDIAQLRLTTPSGENAHARYLEVLALDADNADALRGLERIVEKYVELSEQLRERGQHAKAESYLNRASRVLPASTALMAARRRLADARRGDENRRPITASPAVTSPEAQTHHPSEPLEDPRIGTLPANARDVSVATLDRSVTRRSPRPATMNQSALPLRIAILPFGRRRSSRRFFHQILTEKLTRAIEADERLRLVYSYYDPVHDRERVDYHELWTGGPVNSRLVEEGAIAIAHRLKADLIVTVRLPIAHSGMWGNLVDETDYEADFYLLHVRRARLHRGKDKVGVADEVLARLLAQVEAFARRSGAAALTEPQQTGVATPAADSDEVAPSARAGIAYGDAADTVHSQLRRVAILPPHLHVATQARSDLYLKPDDVRRQVLAYLHKRTDRVVYVDYMDKDLDDDSAATPELWQGSLTEKTPDAESVYRIGNQLGVDAVLIWSATPKVDFLSWPVTLYLYDISGRREYRVEGTNVDTPELLHSAFQSYLDSGSAVAAPQSQPVPSATRLLIESDP